ncbi:ribosome 60S biogenesis amino-terminal protein [Acetobacter orientalis]|uniref:Ribosome 60S biogenesis amino-terminal protein n=1 Tax=Acetobacter orientalis TaxID=146474 RepID=A0A2Z5ZCW7_9PROT|nr:ribosome 60S biogenesis amino-terminal protein [Acetobacter orientalis]
MGAQKTEPDFSPAFLRQFLSGCLKNGRALSGGLSLPETGVFYAYFAAACL